MKHMFEFLMNRKSTAGKLLALAFVLLSATGLRAEGSKDFINYPGYRLFLDNRSEQQLKVYAKAGETINVGASHVGIAGGFIKVYRPDGTLAATFDGVSTTAPGIIFNNIQEAAGPVGNPNGFVPGTVSVGAGQAGVWTVHMGFPTYQAAAFGNLLNNAPWTRAANQPTTPTVITAWDITISQNGAANAGGTMVEGRVYSNEYASVISQNGFMTSPRFFVLTKGGFLYQVDFMETDPYRFPITSVSRGMVHFDGTPTYKSFYRADVTRSDNPLDWVTGNNYYYEPQAEDYDPYHLVNNKIFFNEPNPDMPATAQVTDIFRSNTHTTWLFKTPTSTQPQLSVLSIHASNDSGVPCLPGSLQVGEGAWVNFQSSEGGIAYLYLDLNGDGDFLDPVDLTLTKTINAGADSIYWNGHNGQGTVLPVADNFKFNYKLELRDGETHMLLSDIENNAGGVIFKLLSDVQAVSFDKFYYNHTEVGGPVSGGGTGEPQPTNIPYTYVNDFGDNKILDYWSFVVYTGAAYGNYTVDIVDDCTVPEIVDTDGDGVRDNLDIDDDNDGVPDKKEFCNPGGSFACLPGDLDPSGDADHDGILNFKDANDPAVANGCTDANNDGLCDNLPAAYDHDGDGVPDHLDLDSDNDGISDLVEAGHGQPDTDGNGRIDGAPAIFGLNGLYNPIASDPDDFNATETYTRWDWDGDKVPDHDDLDSDNDAINDVTEAGYGAFDTNNDGKIGGTNSPAIVNSAGLSTLIDPAITSHPIPLPPDRDNDGIRNWHDLDSDNDLILDVEEADKPDGDDDGVLGTGVPVVDIFGKPTADANGQPVSTTSSPKNTDGDIRYDFLDHDSDNDGILDVAEMGSDDPDNNGMPGSGTPAISSKGVPFGPNFHPTSHPRDTDSDLVRDYRDLDADNDGINDVAEASQPDGDNDGVLGVGFPTVNADGRAYTDSQGTPLVTTSNPPNTDNDVAPDYLDLDTDNDGIWDVTEATLGDPDHDGIVGLGTPSVNSDGQASAPNLTPTSNPTNTDGLGQPDFRDLDSDQDGITDADECPHDGPCTDGDSDSTPDFRDPDRDNDGIADSYECETSTPCTDTDTDGISDVDDLDTDGDGLTDAEECSGGNPCPDSNSNNIPNWREYTCHAGTTVAQIENLGSNISACAGENVSLSAENNVALAGNVTYNWTGPNGFTFTGSASPQGPFPLTLSNVTADNAGSYSLTVYTVHQCPSQPASINLTVNTMPTTPSLSASNLQPCNGNSVTLTTAAQSGQNIQYQWYFGATLLTTTTTPSFELTNVNQTNAGDYSVKVTNGNCESAPSAPVAIVVSNVANTTPALTVSEDALCQGEILALGASGIGSGATYQWFFNNGNNVTIIGTTTVPALTLMNVTPANTGTYSVVASAGGCTSPPSNAEVVVVGGALNQAPVLTAANDAPCQGVQLELTTTAYPGVDVTYQWMFNSGNGAVTLASTATPNFEINNVNNSNSGTYLVVASTTGCPPQSSNMTNVAVNTVASQTPNLTVANAVLCQTESIQLSTASVGSGGKYYWYFNGTPLEITNTPSLSIANATPSNTGDYSVAVSFNGCTSPQSAPQAVTVNTVLAQTPVLTANQANLCTGNTLQLTATAISGATYEWFFNDGSGNGTVSFATTQTPIFTIANAQVTNSGLYTVQASISGCVSQLSNNQNVVVFDQTGTAPTLFVSANVLCEGTDLTLSTTALPGNGVTYEWFFNNGSSQFSLATTTIPSLQLNNLNANASGLYYVVASNGNCVTPASTPQNVTVSNDIGPALSLSVVNDVICEGELLELNSSIFPSTNVTYNWYFNNGTSTVLLGSTNMPTFFVQNMAAANQGVYTVTASIGNCVTQPSNAQDVYVTNALNGAPTLTASATQLCYGETLTLNSSIYPGTNAQYQWYFNNGTTNVLLATTNVPTYFINNMLAANAGTYSVVVASGNCTTQPSNTAQVAVSNLAGQSLQLTTSDNNLCQGQMLTLTSSAAGTNMQYQWYFNNGNGNVLLAVTSVPTYFIQNTSAANVGTYSVSATNGNCSTPMSNLEAVTMTQAPQLVSESSTEAASPACLGELVQLNVTPVAGATYQWSGPQGFNATTPNPILPEATTGQAGEYTATVTLNGCSFTAPSATVHVFTGIAAADDLFDVQFNQPLTNGVLVFNDQVGNVQSWDIRIVEQPTNGSAAVVDGELEYTPNNNYYGQDVLVYEICNTDCPDNCARATVRLNVLGSNVEQPCFVPDIITPNGDGKNDFFTVPCLETTYTNNNVRIFNRWGDKIFEQDSYENDWDSRYKGNLLPPGTYFYLIQLDKQNSEKIMQGYFTITR